MSCSLNSVLPRWGTLIMPGKNHLHHFLNRFFFLNSRIISLGIHHGDSVLVSYSAFLCSLLWWQEWWRQKLSTNQKQVLCLEPCCCVQVNNPSVGRACLCNWIEDRAECQESWAPLIQENTEPLANPKTAVTQDVFDRVITESISSRLFATQQHRRSLKTFHKKAKWN